MRQRLRLQDRPKQNDKGKLNNTGVSKRLQQLRLRKKDWRQKLLRQQRPSVNVLKMKKLLKQRGKGFRKKNLKLVQEKRLPRKLRNSA